MTLKNTLNSLFRQTPRKALKPQTRLVHVDADGKEWDVARVHGPVWRSEGCQYTFGRIDDLRYQVQTEGGKLVRRKA